MPLLARLGQRTIRAIQDFGDFCVFCAQTLRQVPVGLSHGRNFQLLLPQFYEIGTKSIPVVMVTGAFVGAVLAVQTVTQFKNLGLANQMGIVINLSVLRELGPVLAGVMLAGRVGGGQTAELGTMRVTEQIDALRALGADPIRVLVVPRFLASVLLIPILVLYANFMGILGGYFISVVVYGIGGSQFWRSAGDSVGYFDIFYGPLKSIFFGGVLSLICCYKGFSTEAGAAGVGKACTESFVQSFMSILSMNFFLGMLLNTVYEFFYGTRSIL